MPGDALAVELRQFRLRIPRVHLRGAARCENMDDVLGLGREMRRLRRERADHLHAAGVQRRSTLCPRIDSKNRSQAHSAKSHACAQQELTPGEDDVIRGRRVLANVFVSGFGRCAHDGFLGLVVEWTRYAAG